MTAVLIYIFLLWILPFWLSQGLAKKKGSVTSVLGFFLGWLGYFISLTLPYTPEYIKSVNENSNK